MRPPERPPVREGKPFALGFSAALIAAVLWPVRENWREEPRDPLSYYPMFTAKRRRRVRETYLLGRTADGGRRALHYRLAGSGGLNLSRRQMRRMAGADRGEEVCRLAARNIVKRDVHRDVVRVQLVTGQYVLKEYFSGNREPLKERVRAECDVPWPAA